MAEYLYPLALRLRGRRVTLIGGGEVAARKLQELLAAGAEVFVVAPHPSAPVQEMAAQGHIRLGQRLFQAADVSGAVLVIAATDDPATNHRVWEAARAQGIWVNVVDDPPHCDCYTPAVLRRGPVTVAINTGGNSPALAAWLRAHLEACIPPEVEMLAELLPSFRRRVQEHLPSFSQRKAFWEHVMDDNLIALAQTGGAQEVQKFLEQALQAWLVPPQ
ncbi:MAG: bifunctional precorrin-2 dehydrogenase/sirohydrochlorin ferrochelatase [Caldilineae bacterium]|nr:MAG: bifunctional precorrin-2 dehydrogenase/sirohydrochlorin ferrochelatase [Caldilineae bacterium]